jgi:hypothetical protein
VVSVDLEGDEEYFETTVMMSSQYVVCSEKSKFKLPENEEGDTESHHKPSINSCSESFRC